MRENKSLHSLTLAAIKHSIWERSCQNREGEESVILRDLSKLIVIVKRFSPRKARTILPDTQDFARLHAIKRFYEERFGQSPPRPTAFHGFDG